MKTTDGFPAETGGKWTREKVKRYLVQRFYTRFHMSLILSSSAFAAMLANWLLLNGGVHAMWMRYPLTVSVAYMVFLAGVWLWLQYMGLGQRSGAASSLVDNLDVPDIPLGNGGGELEMPNLLRGGGQVGGQIGGQFGGGGAQAAWTEGEPAQAFAATTSFNASPVAASDGTSSGFGIKLDGFSDLDGEGLILLLLALLLIASVFLLSGYVIWFAPDILSEAATGALLAGSLAKTAKRHDSEGWVEGVVKKTWWPFAIVLALSMVFAVYAATYYPQARTFGQAVRMTLGG